MSRYLKYSAWTLAGLTGLALLAIVGLWWLLATEPGSRWLMARGTALAAPELRYTAVNGTLLNGLSVRNLDYRLPGESTDGRLTIAAIDGRWNLWNLLGGQLTIDQLRLHDIRLTLPEGNSSDPAPPPAWPSLALPLPVELKNLEIDRFALTGASQTQVIDRIQLAALAGPLRIRLRQLNLIQGDNRLSLTGHLSSRRPYTTDLQLQWRYQLPGEGPYSGVYNGEASLTGGLDNLTIDHHLATPFTLNTQAHVQLAMGEHLGNLPDKLRFRIDSNWPDIPLQTGNRPPLTSTGTLRLDGTPARIDVDFATRLQGETPQGTPQALGRLNATGTLNPLDGLHWDATLAIEDFPLAAATAELDGALGAQLKTRGRWQGDDYRIELVIEQLDGSLADEPVSGTGQVVLQPDDYRIENLDLRIGQNQLQLDAHLDHTPYANWEIHLPDLQPLLPGLQGAVTGNGTAGGTADALQVDGKLSASNLAYGDWAIGSLQLQANSDAHHNLDIRLEGSGIDLPGWTRGTVQVTATGTLEDHQIGLTAGNPDLSLALQTQGGYQQPEWQGQILSLTLDHIMTGPWQLARPAALAAGSEGVELGQACLGREQATACTRGKLKGDELALSLNTQRIDLSWLSPWLPPELIIRGTLDGGGRISGTLKQPTGQLALSVGNGTLQLARATPENPDDASPESQIYPFTLTAEGELAADRLDSDINLTIAPGGHFDARVSVPTTDPQAPLTGTVTGRFSTLSWLDGFLPEVEQLDGSARLDLSLAGQLTAPSVQGALYIEQAQLMIPAAGLALADGSASLQFDNLDTVRVSADIGSGEGRLALDGDLDLSDPGLATGSLQLRGNRFTLVDRPDTRIVVNPDLAISLTPDTIAIGGELVVVQGRVQLQPAGTDAVQVSADEHIVSAEPDTSRPGRPLTTSVRLRLGDDFHFEGYGLGSRLTGSLRLTQTSGSPPRGVGNIRVRDGRFTAYGQKLTIDNGVLIFQGPLDNPGLNIRAERETRYATVGLVIGGTAKNITSELFSNPALSETDTLAVLVTGKPLSESSQADANLIANAATSLGIARSGWITGKLQSTFGLDTVKLQGGDSYEDSALVVGKYLTPDLFVSYVQNLFTPEGTIQLDYSLSRHIGVKATSGEKQTVDILYRIEH